MKHDTRLKTVYIVDQPVCVEGGKGGPKRPVGMNAVFDCPMLRVGH